MRVGQDVDGEPADLADRGPGLGGPRRAEADQRWLQGQRHEGLAREPDRAGGRRSPSRPSRRCRSCPALPSSSAASRHRCRARPGGCAGPKLARGAGRSPVHASAGTGKRRAGGLSVDPVTGRSHPCGTMGASAWPGTAVGCQWRGPGWATSSSKRRKFLRADSVLTLGALEFLEALHQRFAIRRRELLDLRQVRRETVALTGNYRFPAGDRADPRIRLAGRPDPGYLADRRVEITGPTDRKMTINAMNSGAKIWLADLEDANTPPGRTSSRASSASPTPSAAPSRSSRAASSYALNDGPLAVIVARPRGWHLDEKHLRLDGEQTRRRAGRLRAVPVPQRRRAARARPRAGVLPAEDGVAPRGPAVGRGVRVLRGVPRHASSAPSGRPC